MNNIDFLFTNQANYPLMMGILNLTEDSFSDANKYMNPTAAMAHAENMLTAGAHIIDIGAESTRPGAKPMDETIELTRVLPILSQLKEHHPESLVSIDTRKSSVALAALEAKADIINDISAALFDSDMAELVSSFPHAKLILMHMQGTPETMQLNPSYKNIVDDVKSFLTQRIDFCLRKGIKLHNLMIDPGIGFGKNLKHNLELINRIDEFSSFGLPIVLGASRKSFINQLVPSQPQERLGGSLAVAAWALQKGITIIRCHDVDQHMQFLKVIKAISQPNRIGA